MDQSVDILSKNYDAGEVESRWHQSWTKAKLFAAKAIAISGEKHQYYGQYFEEKVFHKGRILSFEYCSWNQVLKRFTPSCNETSG